MGVLYRYYHLFSQNFTGQHNNMLVLRVREVGEQRQKDVAEEWSRSIWSYLEVMKVPKKWVIIADMGM